MESSIVWNLDEGQSIRRTAVIGQYEYDGDTNYVFGVIYFGFPEEYGWDVRVCKVPNPNSPLGMVVWSERTNNLNEAMNRAEYVGKEWIKGDSDLWKE